MTRGQQFTYSGDICYAPGESRQLLHIDVNLRDKLYKMRREYTADTLATFHTESKNVKTFKSDTNLHAVPQLPSVQAEECCGILIFQKKISSKLRAE